MKMSDFSYFELVEYYRQMDDNTLHSLILHYEKQVDKLLAQGKISQEDAWDCYFGLLNECDCRNFLQDRERILAKIDTKLYNPLESKNPNIIHIVRFRAKMHGLI